MNLQVVTRAAIALAGFFMAGSLTAFALEPVVVSNVDELIEAQRLVALPAAPTAEPVTIKVLAGTYLLKDSFRIERSQVNLVGEPGAKFILANNINEPVLVIGSQDEVAGPSHVISDIVVTGLEIDGNKENQRSEFSARRPWIRNNGIDVRAVTRLNVAKVVSNNNRSGGLVISWGCSDIKVTESVFAKNFFDGVAFYASAHVAVSDCTMTKNQGAGVSLDNDFVDSQFSRCVLEANADVGVFARSSARLEFRDCIVRHSGNWAIFLAHDEHGRGVVDVVIAGGQITGNRGGVCMASVNEQQSRGTRVMGALFSANEANGRGNIYSCGSVVEATDIAGSDSGKGAVLNLATIH